MTPPIARGTLRVAQIIHGAGVGGTERHVRSLLGGLPAHGVVPILIISNEGPLLDFAQSRGIETHVVPRASAWSYLRALTQLLKELRPDVVHAHSGRLPCIAARRARVPRIVETRHGALIGLSVMQRWPGLALAEGWKCRAAHRTITVCASDREWLIARGGLNAKRVSAILNGIEIEQSEFAKDGSGGDPGGGERGDGARAGRGDGERARHGDGERARLGDRERARRGDGERERLGDGAQEIRTGAARGELGVGQEGRWIGFVGRLTAQKAPERIIDLLAELRRSDPRWRALILGDGPKIHSLRDRGRSQGIEDAIVWMGSDPRGQMAMRAVDCVCLPSLSEGLPYVLLEALAVGVPILATPVGGISEVLSGPVLERGCLQWSLAGWAERIQELTDPAFSSEWKQAAHERIRTLNESSMLRVLASVYREALPSTPS